MLYKKLLFHYDYAMLTRKDLHEIELLIEEKLEEKFKEKLKFLPTKDEFYRKMDEVMGELKAIRDEMAIVTGRVAIHTDQLDASALLSINPE